MIASGLSLPAKRVTVNLAPADLPKEGSHYDLPIALALMAAMGAIPAQELEGYVVLGELGLDGTLAPVAGVLPAAIGANGLKKGLICPAACGPEAAWADREMDILAPRSLIQLANHFKGSQVLSRPLPKLGSAGIELADLGEVRGQETAKRALEITAAGGHNLLMVGPPGAGKSMLASRLPSILPPLSPKELLEVSMIASVAGELADGRLSDRRPFRAPHHSASMAALVGGGIRARPGEVSLAHNGVLFLDELPEFHPQVLDSLRQPLEAGETVIVRANHRVSYPSRIQLIAAMNPCRCGYAGEPGHVCKRGDRCAGDYQARISGPLIDRIDIRIEVPAVTAGDLIRMPDVGKLRCRCSARCGGERAAGPAIRGFGCQCPHQCGSRSQAYRGNSSAGRGRIEAFASGGRQFGAFGAGLSPGAEGGANAGRSGRGRYGRAAASGGSAELSWHECVAYCRLTARYSGPAAGSGLAIR